MKDNQAIARNLLVAPRKLRLLSKELKGRSVGQASELLSLLPHRGAKYLQKAMQTAAHNLKLGPDSTIAAIEVNEGMKLKRFVLANRGASRAFFKARSHVRFTFSEEVKGKTEKEKAKTKKSKATAEAVQPTSDTVS